MKKKNTYSSLPKAVACNFLQINVIHSFKNKETTSGNYKRTTKEMTCVQHLEFQPIYGDTNHLQAVSST